MQNNIFILVTDQMSCKKLIDLGYELQLRDYQDHTLCVLSVMPKHKALQSGQALEYLFTVSRQVGAEMTVLYDDNTVKAAIDYIKRKNADLIILGKSPGGIPTPFVKNIMAALPDVSFHFIPVPMKKITA